MKQKSLKINYVMNIILTMSSLIFPLISFPYVSRVLLPVGMGKVSFATSLISYFSMFAQLGIPTYGIRACAKVRDNREELSRVVQELLIINLATCLISYIALGIVLATVQKLQTDKILYILISFTIVLNTIGIEWLYKALEQYTYITIRSLIFKIIALIAMFLLVQQQSDYIIYGAISIFAASASNIFNIFNAHKYIDFKPVGNYVFERHYKAIFVFFLMACASSIYTNLDNVMLGFISTDAEVGYYNTAIKIKDVLVSLVVALGTVLLPRVSYFVENEMHDEFNRITQKALSFVFLLATPLVVYFIFFAKESIYLISGEAYTGSILPMQILMPTLLFIGFSNVLGIQMLVPLGKEKIVLYSEIAGAIVDLIINALLIPKFAATGAAIGTLSAELLVLAVQYSALKDNVTDTFKKLHYGRIMISLILGLLASLWIKRLEYGCFLTLALSAILFFGVYSLYLLIRKEDIVTEIVNTLISRAKGILWKK